MKLKKVAPLCIKDKTFMLINKTNRNDEVTSQWLGNGYAFYSMEGLPYMTEEGIYTMFDVPEKQRANCKFQYSKVPAFLSLDDICLNEKAVIRLPISIVHSGIVLNPLETSKGIKFIDNKYLSPVSDELDRLELFERTSEGGHTYIAVKAGLVLIAIILAVDVLDQQFVDTLQNLTSECERAFLKSRYKDNGEHFSINMVTGELIEETDDDE